MTWSGHNGPPSEWKAIIKWRPLPLTDVVPDHLALPVNRKLKWTWICALPRRKEQFQKKEKRLRSRFQECALNSIHWNLRVGIYVHRAEIFKRRTFFMPQTRIKAKNLIPGMTRYLGSRRILAFVWRQTDGRDLLWLLTSRNKAGAATGKAALEICQVPEVVTFHFVFHLEAGSSYPVLAELCFSKC